MPRSSSSGSSTSRRSIAPASGAGWFERPALEDRPGTVEDRARMAGWIHGQTAPRAERTPRGQHRLGLLGEGDDLLVAQPEPDATGVLRRRAVLAGCRLAGDQHEHLARLVVAEAHL